MSLIEILALVCICVFVTFAAAFFIARLARHGGLLQTQPRGMTEAEAWENIHSMAAKARKDAIERGELDPLPEPRCFECHFWDYEEGQAVLRAHQPFFQASQVLSPAEMGRQVTYENERPCTACTSGEAGTGRFMNGVEVMETCSVCDGAGFLADGEVIHKSGVPHKVSWAHFGACLCPQQAPDGDSSCTWADDKCEHFEQAVPAERLRRRRLPVFRQEGS